MLKVSIFKKLPEFDLDINFENNAKVLAIFGPSGSGKTSVLNILSGMDSKFTGEIKLYESILFSSSHKICIPPEKRKIGYVFQESLLFPHLNIFENLMYGYNKKSSFNPEKVIELMELSNILKRTPMQISGGEKQRVALGRALLSSPQLLLLDEPLINLDFLIKNKIIFYLNKIKHEFSIPIIYVTHYIEEVIALADDVIVLNKGKIIDKGIPESVLKNPSVLPVAVMTGLENIFDIEIKEQSPQQGITYIYMGKHTVSVPYISDINNAKIGIAANEIILALREPDKISARNVLSGTIIQITPVYNKIVIQIDIGGEKTLFSEITLPAYKELDLKTGQNIFVIFKSNSIKLLYT
ncbi:MAG: molybdenum ABC transporter ATP-binding protein [Candidatus Firestonebacteria bacterium]|nr:molybdenum ABC transporter ATP-binding protein [Candidatus Firestonebacteria bacterium]